MRLSVSMTKAENPDAPTVVLLHAFPLDGRMWKNQIEFLKNDYNVIAPDTRGFGKSRLSEYSQFSTAIFAEDVRKTLESLNVSRFILGGCSMGGYVSFEFWRRHAECVSALLLFDTRAEADTDATRQKRAAQIEKIRLEGTGFLPDFVEENLLGPGTRANNPELVKEVRSWASEAPAMTVIHTLEVLASRPDSGPTLPTIDVPVLAIVGTDDKPTPVECSERIVREVKNGQLAVIPNAGHLAALENPTEVNRVLGEFLKTVTLPV